MDGLWGFVVLAAVLSLTPGPDDVLVIGSAVRGGPRLGAASAAGIAVGSLAWGAASGVGLAGVLARSPAVYDSIRLTGAGYLVVLGLVPLLAPLVRRGRPVVVVARGPEPDRLRAAFAAGLCSDLLNPKIGMFYLAGVPQFVPAGQPVLGWSLLLSGIDVAVAMVWFAGLIGLASAALARLRRPAVAVWSQRLAGASLVGVGLTAALTG
jgi:threonine/homoserine/homoserine lactone efflux protein